MGLFDLFKKKNNVEETKEQSPIIETVETIDSKDVENTEAKEENSAFTGGIKIADDLPSFDETDKKEPSYSFIGGIRIPEDLPTFQNKLDEKLDSINDVVEKAIDVVIETFEEYQEKNIDRHITREIFANVKDKINSKLDKTNDIIEDIIDIIIETFEEKKSTETTGNKIKITKELLKEKFKEKQNKNIDNAVNKVAELISSENSLENVAHEVTKIIDDSIEPTNPSELESSAIETIEAINEVAEDTVDTAPNTTIQEEPVKESLFAKMKKGLLKTKDNFTNSLDNVFKAFTKIDDDFYDELEETLILSDLGARTSMDIIATLRAKVKENKIHDTAEVKALLIQILTEILNKNETTFETPSPTVILVIGVNGVGKTTTIGKLASLYKNEGKNVLLAAGDTFRAAAIDQLEEWGRRSDIPVIKHAENSDSSAVIYDAIQSAKAKKTDILICDTAGRLHNKKNLMAELEKINRVINKEFENAHLETLLVLDGTSGQNAIEQAKQFNEVCNITGLVLTKLDGTAKGGVVISIKNELNIPVRFVGVGEKIGDLQHFNAEYFSKALFDAE